jgi:hypothetical protein
LADLGIAHRHIPPSCPEVNGKHGDRVGIWLEPDASAESAKELAGAFHGLAWDYSSDGNSSPLFPFSTFHFRLSTRLVPGPKPSADLCRFVFVDLP